MERLFHAKHNQKLRGVEIDQRRSPHEYLEELSSIVFGRRWGFRAMAFFRVYLDASKSEGDSPYLVLAGYIASAEQWGRFVDEWSEILRTERIDVWHMVDFNVRGGKYRGWGDERCERVYEQLIQVIRAYVSFGVVTAIDLKAYDEMVVGRELRRHFGSPYQCCVYTSIEHVCYWARENSVTQRVAYILEHGDTGQGKMLKRTFSKVFEDEAMREKFQLSSLTTVSKKQPEATPCQAADILAWEYRRELEEQRRAFPRPASPTLDKLFSPGVRTVVCDRDTIPGLIAPIITHSD